MANLRNILAVWHMASRSLELAANENQESAIRVISGANEFSRAVFQPPGTPEGRVQVLREAFDRTMKDPAFLAEADRMKLPIEPTGGADLDKIAAQIVASPSCAIALAMVIGE